MTLFSNAKEFEINGGQFTAISTNNNYLSGPTGIDILREASAPEAAHDSSARAYSARCFPGTREQYIEDIIHQAIPSLGDTPPPIYWMRGPAGVGKSAIAQTCAERLQEAGALGAAFFFSIASQRKPEKFFPSIAYQLSTVHPAYRDLIDIKIRHDKTLISKAMRFQFRYLIDEPLRELEESGKGIRGAFQIFIDGLDECEGIEAQCEIIRIVAASVSKGGLPLRWAFFSRPELHIEAMFSTTEIDPHCHKAVLPISRDADEEIELYLRNGLDNIPQRRRTLLKAPWPTTEEINIVVDAASGLFIYATTIVRFVGHPDSINPQSRLRAVIDVILERRSRPDADTDAPLAELDAFYRLILQRIPTKVFQFVHLLLAVLCRLGRRQSAIFVANLLGMSQDEFETVAHHVSAVVHLEDPGKEIELDSTIDTSSAYPEISQNDPDLAEQILLLGGQIGFYHKSFPDFLVDSERSGRFCVRPSEALVKHFAKLHLDYDRSVCWHGSELVLAPGVPDSAASLSYPYTNELLNSIIKAWVYAWVGDDDPNDFPMPQTRGWNTDCDFRKWLYTHTNITCPGYVFGHMLWGCACSGKYFRGVYIAYISQFHKSTINKFKSMVEWREKAGVIQQYQSASVPRVRSPRRNKYRGSETALYYVGHGEKAIFWYWEINHRLQYYREFRSIDLAEGKKRFQEEDFDSWPDDEDTEGGEEI